MNHPEGVASVRLCDGNIVVNSVGFFFSGLFSRERNREEKKRDREEDEEEAYERRKLERKLREKEAAYQEVHLYTL